MSGDWAQAAAQQVQDEMSQQHIDSAQAAAEAAEAARVAREQAAAQQAGGAS